MFINCFESFKLQNARRKYIFAKREEHNFACASPGSWFWGKLSRSSITDKVQSRISNRSYGSLRFVVMKLQFLQFNFNFQKILKILIRWHYYPL